MDLKNKLKGIPKIYYFNLDERPDRQEYTETQYEKYKISNYVRHSMSKYQFNNFDEWKEKLILNDPYSSQRPKFHIVESAILLSYLEFFKTWLETTDEQMILVMEDDYDLSYIDYWHFDWEYLMDSMPFDWDSIQLSFENFKVPCFLHPILSGHGMGASVLSRQYVERIVNTMTVDGKFDLTHKICNSEWIQRPNLSIDYVMGHLGKTYCLPLIVQSTTIGSFSQNILRDEDFPTLHFTARAVDLWWKRFRDKFSLEDFFSYGKNKDFIITKDNIKRFEELFLKADDLTELIEENKKEASSKIPEAVSKIPKALSKVPEATQRFPTLGL